METRWIGPAFCASFLTSLPPRELSRVIAAYAIVARPAVRSEAVATMADEPDGFDAAAGRAGDLDGSGQRLRPPIAHGSDQLAGVQLEAYANDLRKSYAREVLRTQQLHATYLATVQTLAAAVEAKDEYTGGHIQRVNDLGLLLASAVVPDEALDPQLSYGLLLHDIGKLSVPDAVLNKPGRLDAAEWELMRRHPEEGARILAAIPFLDRALDIVLHHHERWDGQGYPTRLRGEAIPLWARMFALVDAVDAMTSDRPYRRARSLEDAICELRRGSGSQFDPACVKAFEALAPETVRAVLQHGPRERASDGVASPRAATRVL